MRIARGYTGAAPLGGAAIHLSLPQSIINLNRALPEKQTGAGPISGADLTAAGLLPCSHLTTNWTLTVQFVVAKESHQRRRTCGKRELNINAQNGNDRRWNTNAGSENSTGRSSNGRFPSS